MILEIIAFIGTVILIFYFFRKKKDEKWSIYERDIKEENSGNISYKKCWYGKHRLIGSETPCFNSKEKLLEVIKEHAIN